MAITASSLLCLRRTTPVRIQSACHPLHQASKAYLNPNPNGVFDIEESEQARLCFFILRTIIRRNDRALDDELRFSLDIPAVKALAHQEVTPGQPNELLRLAMVTGNTEASTLLLNIEAVRELAQQNEALHGVDLRQLAQNRESSSTALTTGEAKRLELAFQRYQPMIYSAGVRLVIQGLRDELIHRHEKNPATFVDGQGNVITLPFEYQEFQALKLESNDLEKALTAYYKHQDHTAWRYLAKPNLWMHPRGGYGCINEESTERWSNIEVYQPLIAMLYLAAVDKESKATQGHTLDTRLNHFINELALIGRAHNWDRTRIRNDKEEEYDDLEGDKPSCSSGVKRRLFQSVVGHSLFEALSEATIEAEIRQFAFEHFRSILTNDNKQRFKTVFDKCYGLDENGDGSLNTEDAEELRILTNVNDDSTDCERYKNHDYAGSLI